MKKVLIAVLAFMCACGAAFAQEVSEYAFGEFYSCDLNGDGTAETWGFTEDVDSEGWPVIRLTVESNDADQAVSVFDMDASCWYKGRYLLCDMNKDGIKEIIVTANTSESGGSSTYCLNYAYGKTSELMFAEPDYSGRLYSTMFPGSVYSIEDDAIVLMKNLNILGTWKGIFRYTLSESGRMELCNDGWYERFFDPEAGEMEDYWEWQGMTLKIETAYRDGDQIGMLYPGDMIMITGANLDDEVSFITKDGRQGILYVDSKADTFGWMVNCQTREELEESAYYSLNPVDEDDCFNFVPYSN